MNIGKLHQQQDGTMSGFICTLKMDINFNLEKNPERNNNPKAPTYIIMAGKADLGRAWENTANKTGEVYLSLELDDPSFFNKLKCAAFRNQDGTWRIVWDRQQPQVNTDQVAA